MLRRTLSLAALGMTAVIAAAAPASAQNVVPCAREGGFCRVPYPTTVVYGYRGAVSSRQVQGGGIPCNNAVFGDPAPNVVKSCGYVVRGYDRQRRYDRYDGEERRYRRRDY